MEAGDGCGFELWRVLARAHAAVGEAVERALASGACVEPIAAAVLVHIAAAPAGGPRMQDLADGVGLSPSGLTRLVDRLERAGLVRRTSCPSDRRGTYALLTERGVAAAELVRATVDAALARHFAGRLTRDEAESLAAALRKLAAPPSSD